MKSVTYEAVYKELDDSLTSSERVFKLSNDLLVAREHLISQAPKGLIQEVVPARGNTLQSDEDSMKLNKLMELCTTLKLRVLDLEQIKTTQANKIDILKRRVKKLKKKQSTTATTAKISIDEVTLAQALAELKHTKPKAKAKGIVFHEPEESTTTIPKPKSQDKSKAIMIEEPVKLKKKDQIMLDEEVTLKLQAKAFQKVNTFVDFRIELVEDLKQLMKIIPEEEISIDVIPLAVKSLIVDWKIYIEGKKSYYQIVRAGEKSKMYLVFSHMLKDFNKEDLEDLYNLVKAKYGSTRPVEDLDLKTMLEPHVEDEV
uniref:Reverse transcriptase domain-containing protein n=1 Tax=Tanacetum cinerariifolium TaxID=118510 RepID=A0A6L2MT45_TANCI|nr:hypothetical protein [Tanacetum cinerariifolium]